MLTKRQAEAHRFIFEFIRDKGRGPQLIEIAQAMGSQNPNSGEHYVHILIRKGFVARDKKHQLYILIPPGVWFKAIQPKGKDQSLIPLEEAA